MTTEKQYPSINILDVPLSLLDQQQLLAALAELVAERRKSLVLSGNVHALNLTCRHAWLRALFQRATIVRIDGFGVRLGARILGRRTPARMTWADFIHALAPFCAQHGLRLFFLGSRPGIAEQAADQLRRQYPGLSIVGTHHGHFDKTPGSAANAAVIAAVNAAQPDILLLGFGMPLQERWLTDNWEQVNVPVTMTAGAALDYISGNLRRGPRWMTDHGLEWLARLLIEPRRLWRRYILGNPTFLARVIAQRLGLRRSA